MRSSLAADASVADFHNNLALLLRETGRAREAAECLRRAIALAPAWAQARSNLGLALESAGAWNEAVATYREAIATHPSDAIARQNLARVLLAQGDFANAWEEYRWRLLAQGLVSVAPDPHAKALPSSLAGRRFALLAEQGLGDVLFFLRFARELVARGATLAFRGDGRLHGMLDRTGWFALGIAGDAVPIGDLEAVPVGELPWLLGALDPLRFPALALEPQSEPVDRMRAKLEALGPMPHIALTWRAGLASAGPASTQLKHIEPALLGEALRGVSATWISVQRLPRPGDREALEKAIGAPVHDMSAANDDLEDMLALMQVVDRYAGVSNANVHLRAGVGGDVDVLVPHPPEWRWGISGASPWFARARVYRQSVSGDWSEALRGMRAALTSRAGP
jgi:tetratricopeptide (TPR) repeat protein